MIDVCINIAGNLREIDPIYFNQNMFVCVGMEVPETCTLMGKYKRLRLIGYLMTVLWLPGKCAQIGKNRSPKCGGM